ncbi:hypothetical protein Poli38472_011956 [Pythium oligandrum]|uniref:Glycosyltransferase family 62 protein n=1 Tax=Pythium oligandrum TaxID=41045 RepID=A0A8K1FK80_PYTOL|nr:hypothetical protein Poli38472_011956 [Pythium oligandrum]|eukprot:TMW66840.1 hypothetical protein Poli38472_011956 [Pythium oligandrum]
MILHLMQKDVPPILDTTQAIALEKSSVESEMPVTTTAEPERITKVKKLNKAQVKTKKPKRGLASSVLHPRTTSMPPRGATPFSLLGYREPIKGGPNVYETTEIIPQHGSDEVDVHYQLRNDAILSSVASDAEDFTLIVVVTNDEKSWGLNRSAHDFFELLDTFTHPKEMTSVTLLTSSMSEFDKLQKLIQGRIQDYTQLSLLYRTDFSVSKVTRENRHDVSLQRVRRRMLTRYRNYALLTTLESWHQHVVWLDSDVIVVPPDLVSKMIEADRDILTPLCKICGKNNRVREYDLNAWAGSRTTPESSSDREDLFPGPLNVTHIRDFQNGADDFIPLDSVGGTMLYVRADVHRQGVLFPHHFVIGSEWTQEGYDGIETEGLCYSAHFLGYRCWGMPHEVIYHAPKDYQW